MLMMLSRAIEKTPFANSDLMSQGISDSPSATAIEQGAAASVVKPSNASLERNATVAQDFTPASKCAMVWPRR